MLFTMRSRYRMIVTARSYFRLYQHYLSRHGGVVRGTLRLVGRLAVLGRRGLPAVVTTARRYKSQFEAPHRTIAYETPHKRVALDYSLFGDTRVDVVICVHNALPDVIVCLESVLANRTPGQAIIIVDDGSADETRIHLDNFAATRPQVRLFRNETARGYTFAANQGLGLAVAEHIVLLNSDAVVTPGWLQGLLAASASRKRVGAVSPLSNCATWQSVPEVEEAGEWANNPLPEHTTLGEYAAYLRESSPRIYPTVPLLNGFCILLSRSMLNEIGAFDEDAFGTGYGEENDLCLRAIERNWSLVIADDTYVFHAESKSYTKGRRTLLQNAAGEALVAKHGHDTVSAGVRVMRESLILESARSRARSWAPVRTALAAISRLVGKRIGFVLPADAAGGGANIVIDEARRLSKCGLHVSIVNLERNRSSFEAAYSPLEIAIEYIQTPDDLKSIASSYDALIGTLYITMHWLRPVAKLLPELVIGYYVQDYEPYFFNESDPERVVAVQSYRAVHQAKLFTKTKWNAAEILRTESLEVPTIGVTQGSRLFAPRRHLSDPSKVTVSAMVRLYSPYRSPEMTLRVVQRMARKYDYVRFVIFGSEEVHTRSLMRDVPPSIHFAGKCRPAEVAGILGSSDIFVDFSRYQAMGLTALEAMASGAAVIVPKAGGATEFCTHMVDGLVVDTSSEAACVHSLSVLIENPHLRDRLSRAAIGSAARFPPELSAARLVEILFSDAPPTRPRPHSPTRSIQ